MWATPPLCGHAFRSPSTQNVRGTEWRRRSSFFLYIVRINRRAVTECGIRTNERNIKELISVESRLLSFSSYSFGRELRSLRPMNEEKRKACSSLRPSRPRHEVTGVTTFTAHTLSLLSFFLSARNQRLIATRRAVREKKDDSPFLFLSFSHTQDQRSRAATVCGQERKEKE